jgi:DNA invertase Pin-like site-specific DNA recombinase
MQDLSHDLIQELKDRIKNKIFGYGRSSTDKQTASTMVQKQMVEDWLKLERAYGRQEEFEWGGWYEDPETTSKIPWFERKAAQQMLLNAQPGDVIVVAIYDRAIRSNHDACRCLEDLDRFGIHVKFLDNPAIDTTTIDGRMIFQLISAIAERERRMIAFRTREYYAWARKNGLPINGKAPIGWKVVKVKGKLPSFAPDLYIRDVGAYILKLRKRGLSKEEIYKKLYREGFKNKQGEPFSFRSMERIIAAALADFPAPEEFYQERYKKLYGLDLKKELKAQKSSSRK